MVLVHQKRIIFDIAVHARSCFRFGFRWSRDAERGLVTEFDGCPEGGAGDGLRFGALAVVEGGAVEEAHCCWGAGRWLLVFGC